jgi:type II secretory pathway component PulF
MIASTKQRSATMYKFKLQYRDASNKSKRKTVRASNLAQAIEILRNQHDQSIFVYDWQELPQY